MVISASYKLQLVTITISFKMILIWGTCICTVVTTDKCRTTWLYSKFPDCKRARVGERKCACKLVFPTRSNKRKMPSSEYSVYNVWSENRIAYAISAATVMRRHLHSCLRTGLCPLQKHVCRVSCQRGWWHLFDQRQCQLPIRGLHTQDYFLQAQSVHSKSLA